MADATFPLDFSLASMLDLMKTLCQRNRVTLKASLLVEEHVIEALSCVTKDIFGKNASKSLVYWEWHNTVQPSILLATRCPAPGLRLYYIPAAVPGDIAYVKISIQLRNGFKWAFADFYMKALLMVFEPYFQDEFRHRRLAYVSSVAIISTTLFPGFEFSISCSNDANFLSNEILTFARTVQDLVKKVSADRLEIIMIIASLSIMRHPIDSESLSAELVESLRRELLQLAQWLFPRQSESEAERSVVCVQFWPLSMQDRRDEAVSGLYLDPMNVILTSLQDKS